MCERPWDTIVYAYPIDCYLFFVRVRMQTWRKLEEAIFWIPRQTLSAIYSPHPWQTVTNPRYFRVLPTEFNFNFCSFVTLKFSELTSSNTKIFRTCSVCEKSARIAIVVGIFCRVRMQIRSKPKQATCRIPRRTLCDNSQLRSFCRVNTGCRRACDATLVCRRCWHALDHRRAWITQRCEHDNCVRYSWGMWAF